MRSALHAAANITMMPAGRSCALKAWGHRLMKSKGRKRAVVAVARKLAVILPTMWSDGTEFCVGVVRAAKA